jgi:iron complex transport system permease protein
LAIDFGIGFVPFAIEGFSILGALVVAVILSLFIRRFPQRTALILVGVGLSSLCGALMALVFNLSPSPIATAEILGWMMGSVANRQWSDVLICCIMLGLAVWGVVKYGYGLRLLTLGEDTARSMGLDLVRFTQIMVGLSAALAGVSVAVAGIIGFVGLAAPHMVRGLGIKDPTKLALPSALSGAIMVVIADALVRLVPASGEIRLGVVTSLIGAPIFALLAYKSARSWGSDL